jgi:hypothetical protein
MTRDFPAGNYRFIPAVFQYSSGAAAASGFEIERVRFDRLLPLAEGFASAAKYIQAVGQPLTSFCACELRSPAAFTEDGFRTFNEHYVKTLAQWGLFDGTVNPVARSNVCPEIDPPSEPGFHAFSFTSAAPGAPASFVISGSGESAEGKANYRDHTVRLGDTSPEGMLEKAKWVLDEMERRMSAFSGDWRQATAVQLYTVRNVFPFLQSELGKRGTLRPGLTWHFNRPPVVDLEYEMDCRRVYIERVIEV